jgi:hypothetical protein
MDALTDSKNYMPDAARLATIRKRLDEYNAERPAIMQTAYIQVGLYMGAYTLVLLGIFYLALHSGGGKHNPLGYLFGVLAICGWWVWDFAWRPVKDHQLGLRYRLFPVVFGFIDKVGYSHATTPGFLSAIKWMKLVRFSHSDNDDVIGGTHDGLDFVLVESKLKLRSGKNERTVFRGLIFHFLREDEFPGLLVVARRGNRLQEWVQDLFGDNNDTIATGDSELDLSYELHTDNHAAARKLIDGSLVPALKYLKSEWQAGDPRVALRGRECFLLLPSDRDYFHVPSIGRDVDYEAHVEPMIRDMVVLLAVAHLIRKL